MQRSLYDQLVPYYEVIEGRDWQREVRLIASILRDYQLSTVVDLGCGSGYHVRELSRLGLNAIGIDISRQNIQFARRMAKREMVHARFIVGSYYVYRPHEVLDAALLLNWSIPTNTADILRFLSNAKLILRNNGLLILDYERTSDIVWEHVGKPMMNSWSLKDVIIVRISVGQIFSNVLGSRDVYVLYPKNTKLTVPDERSRYQAPRHGSVARIFVDRSYVRFFRVSEIRRLAVKAGFRMVQNYMLPRDRYKRNYAVLQRVS